MKKTADAFGEQLRAQYEGRGHAAEIIERDDGFIATGSHPGLYFSEYKDWSRAERRALRLASGRVLDVGCGAGRHSLYLQSKGFDVTGIDLSPGAVRVCRLRGLKKVFVRRLDEVDKFAPASFDTVLMLGNNFGLFGSRAGARRRLRKLARVTSDGARIIAQSLDPHATDNPDHLAYHRRNLRRGRMAGQIRMRVRFARSVGRWFDYLLVSPREMEEVLEGTGWGVEKFIPAEGPNYAAVITKRAARRILHT
jgi:SAM-dependent methyltransferase